MKGESRESRVESFRIKNERRKENRKADGAREAREFRVSLQGRFGRLPAVSFNYAGRGTTARPRDLPQREEKT